MTWLLVVAAAALTVSLVVTLLKLTGDFSIGTRYSPSPPEKEEVR